jgi:hypothetical protein
MRRTGDGLDHREEQLRPESGVGHDRAQTNPSSSSLSSACLTDNPGLAWPMPMKPNRPVPRPSGACRRRTSAATSPAEVPRSAASLARRSAVSSGTVTLSSVTRPLVTTLLAAGQHHEGLFVDCAFFVDESFPLVLLDGEAASSAWSDGRR